MPNPEAGNNPEEELNKAAIASSTTFDELYQALEMLGGVQGSKQRHSAEELKATINLVRKGQERPIAVTRSLGLRDKVTELLLKPEEPEAK
ncbi:MAG TPA: hypothetical protein VGQ87_00920 [Patescibacteria group bacterium]|jgi:hypothetical protein|nr:hypothetical protein [Patescibacteria group bacterium]